MSERNVGPRDGQDAVEEDPVAADPVADGAVLDELSVVFGDDASVVTGPSADEASNTVADGGVERDDDSTGGSAEVIAPSPKPPPSTEPPPGPPLIDPGLRAVSPTGSGTDEDAGPAPTDDGSGVPGSAHTIRIGDEELPDAAYLDEELLRTDEQGAGGPVFIDDDDTDDAIVASDATGGRVDTRLRQRRIGVRRAEGRRRLHWVFIGAGVLVALVAVVAVLASSLFSVNQITIVGNRYADPDALKRVIVDLDGTPVLLVDTDDLEEQLEAIPWVEDARVRTSFPNSATIELRERTPVAATPGADGLSRVLDREGRVLDVIEGQPIALIWIAGPITLDLPAGDFAPPGPTGAASLVPKLTPTIRPRVDSIQVTPDGTDLRLYLRPADPEPVDGDEGAGTTAPTEGAVPSDPLYSGPLIEVRFGSALGDNQQIEKLVRLERVLADVGTQRVSVIDVSTAEVTVL